MGCEQLSSEMGTSENTNAAAAERGRVQTPFICA